ncbi:hypothetical protein H5410_026454 [Solanum commersonii]|uniref:Uncharacterized protein n=1 Tax=Solanum commersonii TaxID=4109 RepID=A0A9J5YX42_SOLCO|nr:hypothetical protein H5410_026454 [Solanum commersonii]
MPKWSEKLNPFTYADDTIIFVVADKKSIALIMNTLKDYENQSGQKLCSQSFGGTLELKALYGLTLCGTSIARDIDLNWWNEGEDLKF